MRTKAKREGSTPLVCGKWTPRIDKLVQPRREVFPATLKTKHTKPKMDNILLYIVAITASAVAVLATLLLTRLKKHIARLRDEVNRKVTDLMWHENVLRAIDAKLRKGLGAVLFSRFQKSLPHSVKCPECNHKGAEWITMGCADEGGSVLPIGIICPECESPLCTPFWEIFEMDLGDVKPEEESRPSLADRERAAKEAAGRYRDALRMAEATDYRSDTSLALHEAKVHFEEVCDESVDDYREQLLPGIRQAFRDPAFRQAYAKDGIWNLASFYARNRNR
jgi:hypothetical protein